MRPIEELYPECAKEESETGSFYGPGNYGPILESLGLIVLQVDDDDYQGDSRVLYRDGDRFGLLIFGWGSCSGCDSLQACHNMKEIDELRNELRDKIQWFETKADASKYLHEHDWEGDYVWHAEETKRFIEDAKKLLND